MLIGIQNADVYAPEPVGLRDVLVGGGEILAVVEPGGLPACDQIIDASGLRLTPGLVDVLTHPCGGGGEGGFANRTPEISAEEFALAGVTTPVGALGTDSLGRSLDVLYGNIMALRAKGLGALMYSGAYRVPVPTLTGDVSRDLFLVDPVIGVGEVAIADHRGTQPTTQELRRLGAEVSLGGTLAGYGGTVLVHVGDGETRLSLLREVVAGCDLPPSVFFPTHMNRSTALLDEAAQWAMAGGYVDITVSTTPELIAAGDVPAAAAFRRLIEAGAPPQRITLSSDAGGSLPLYVNGELKGLTAARPHVLMALLNELAASDAELYTSALAAMTRNAAAALGLSDRGRVDAGTRADLLLVEPESGELRHLMGTGRWLVRDGIVTIPAIGA